MLNLTLGEGSITVYLPNYKISETRVRAAYVKTAVNYKRKSAKFECLEPLKTKS